MSQQLHWLERPFRELMRLSWPIAVSTLSYSAMTMADTAFVASLGAPALAGVGLAGVTLFTLLCFPMGLLRGVKVLVSHAVGAGRHGEVGPYLSAALTMSMLLSVVSVGVAFALTPLLHTLAASPEAGLHAVTYLHIRILGAPMWLGFVALRETRYGEGDARSPMVATVVANLAHIALAYVFVIVLGWGVSGVAWSSVISNGIEAGLLLWLMRGSVAKLAWARLEHIAALWRVGLPTGGQFLLEVGSFSLLTVMISAMSEIEMAAHQLVIHLMHLSFLPAAAIAEAGSVMAGQAVGADRDDVVMGVAWRSLAAAVAYTAACTVAYALGGTMLLDLFTDDAALISAAHSLMLVSTLFLVADGANMVARAVLRGAGDVRYAAIVGVVSAWLCTPPLTWLLGYKLGLGATGGWLGLCGEIFVGAIFVWVRLVRGGWHSAAEASRLGIHATAPVPAEEEPKLAECYVSSPG